MADISDLAFLSNLSSLCQFQPFWTKWLRLHMKTNILLQHGHFNPALQTSLLKNLNFFNVDGQCQGLLIILCSNKFLNFFFIPKDRIKESSLRAASSAVFKFVLKLLKPFCMNEWFHNFTAFCPHHKHIWITESSELFISCSYLDCVYLYSSNILFLQQQVMIITNPKTNTINTHEKSFRGIARANR